MKKYKERKWHIQTRILLTLTALICCVLLVVALSFNLSIRQYIRSHLSAQLKETSQGTFRQRKDSFRGEGGEKHFDGHPDRVIGTSTSALLLNADGSLAYILHGEKEAGMDLEGYFMAQGQVEPIDYKILRTEKGSYAVSVTKDPAQEGLYLLIYVDVTSLLSLNGRINLMLLFVILGAILLSAFLSRIFAGTFARPVQQLSSFANEIGGGNLRQQEFHFQDLEFDDLALSMNHMVAELNAARQKQEIFFQNVSHELRTPLTSIRGNAEGIVYGVMEAKDSARVILSESDKLGGMVEDILYLSRLYKSRPEGKEKPLDLREVLSLCVSEQRVAAEGKGVSFHFDFDEEPVLLPIREQDAQRLFSNLISNAIRYAREKIYLTCRREEEEVRVCVSDDGPGIQEEDLPHIFERFYKGKGGKHGIGLAIAQAVAENYRGTLTARNEEGAVFELWFPGPGKKTE